VKKPEPRRLIEGGAVVAIGVAILALTPSQVRTIPGLQTEMSPTFIPTLVAVGLILAGLGLCAQAFLVDAPSGRIDLGRTGLVRVLAAVLLMVAYTILFPRIGFVVTSAVFLGVFTTMFGARSWFKVGLGMVLTPVVVWLFFEQLFRIPLPHGLLF
jgi:putative tricarboxylic transport membrane protein